MAEEALLHDLVELGLNPKKAYTAKDLMKIKKDRIAAAAAPKVKNGFVELSEPKEKEDDNNTEVQQEVIEVANKIKRMPPLRKKKVVEAEVTAVADVETPPEE